MHTFNDLIIAVSETCDVTQIKDILDSGIDVNQQNEFGYTALMFAVMTNELGDHNAASSIVDVVEVLLEVGARLDILDSKGMSAYDYCRQLIDPEFRDDFGYCPLDNWSQEDISVIEGILKQISPPTKEQP